METQKLFEEANSIANSKNEEVINHLFEYLKNIKCGSCKIKLYELEQKRDEILLSIKYYGSVNGANYEPVGQLPNLNDAIEYRRRANAFDDEFSIIQNPTMGTLVNYINLLENINSLIRSHMRCENCNNTDLINIFIKYIER